MKTILDVSDTDKSGTISKDEHRILFSPGRFKTEVLDYLSEFEAQKARNMPKNKGKGGKNRRRGKNESEEKRELIFKEAGQGTSCFADCAGIFAHIFKHYNPYIYFHPLF